MKTGTSPIRTTGVEGKSDSELHDLEKSLARDIPAAQGLLARVRKEIRRRKRRG